MDSRGPEHLDVVNAVFDIRHSHINEAVVAVVILQTRLGADADWLDTP